MATITIDGMDWSLSDEMAVEDAADKLPKGWTVAVASPGRSRTFEVTVVGHKDGSFRQTLAVDAPVENVLRLLEAIRLGKIRPNP